MKKQQNKKSKFRASSKWKKFRKQMKEERKVDAVTGKPLYAGWNLHHCDLDESHYEILTNKNNFECLNKQTHEVVHWLYRYKNWREVMANLTVILEKMEKINNETKRT